ncbi:MAG: FMN-binding protein [Deltaproteobacteria bacterium]|nr:FMN-binding protein [Deltaproteobacteria bacterium]
MNDPTNQTPTVDRREFWRIVRSLAVACVLAATVLGIVFTRTEPSIRALTIEREQETVRRLLDLPDSARIDEIRRYAGHAVTGYLMPTTLRVHTEEGSLLRQIPVPQALQAAPAEERDRWVTEQLGDAELLGRFFIGRHPKGTVAGYVTEASQYGFKSLIRFFVALNPIFQIQGVEILAHEEDPGLGAEITRPWFRNQFIGRSVDDLATLAVVKGPMPADRPATVTADTPIYAVTGATISSRALTDGVKQAVAHLQYRVRLLGIADGGDNE